MLPCRSCAGFLLLLALAGLPDAQAAQPPVAALAPYRIDGMEIRAPLAGLRGDAARGRSVALDRAQGACLLCHAVPEPDQPFMGNLAPPLAGVGARLTAAQLRLRLVDSTRLNSATIMPAYYRVEGLNQVGAAYRGKPILNAQQIEDLVAYLQTLK